MYQQLEKLREKLAKKLSGPTLSDPFNVFPLEIASVILGSLSFRNIMYVSPSPF
jgi:hypothetical protein